ncbi:hypothetical protein O3M35_007198 [Rhynocoris fuscipes]|uniref:TATA-box-binding protein n=1 Tax=Rhynocoris fuscipes TaxID=488301 RepID=A0AAW1D8N1_9HEMI
MEVETATSEKFQTSKVSNSSGNVSETAAPQDSIVAQIPAQIAESGPVPTIQNVVCTVNLGCHLDLLKINTRTRNSEYNPRRFCGVVMRLLSPRSTALVFGSGKIVVTGVRHEEHAVLASRKFARIIQKLGFPVKFENFRIHNMVATCDLRYPIRIESLHQVHGQFSSYEPELFPALIYRMIRPRIVVLIFVNGKIVVTGAKSRADIQEGLDNIIPILKSFRKQ